MEQLTAEDLFVDEGSNWKLVGARIKASGGQEQERVRRKVILAKQEDSHS